jgi:minor histocompatibility antigen H13
MGYSGCSAPWSPPSVPPVPSVYSLGFVRLQVLALGNVPQFQAWSEGGLMYFISLALITIYMGAHRGLNSKERAQIDLKNALVAPALASVSLFGFFLLIKYFPDFSLQTLLVRL